MYRAEDRYFWFVAKHRLLSDLFRRELKSPSGLRMVDIGCGTGGFLANASDWVTAVGVDVDSVALKFCRRRDLRLLIRGEINFAPLAADSFDAAVASDLIEHLDDDAAAVRELYRVIAPGGVAILTVPAMPWLWGPHDVALGHKRRYNRRMLGRLLYDAGFCDIKLFSYMSAPTPIIAAVRIIQKFSKSGEAPETISYQLPGFINRLLLALLDTERLLVLRGFDFFIGTTLVAVARKGIKQ